MRITVSRIIPATPDEVWADVSVLASHAEWMGDAESIEVVSATSSGIGTVLRVPTHIGPLTTEDWIIVTAWEPPVRIGVVHTGIVTGSGEFRLLPEGGSTRFVWDEELNFPLHLGGRLGELMARPIIAAIWAANLDRLAARFI
jgi:carbon monoxide dehydrogenase subunit G